jgi:hypothetical protein
MALSGPLADKKLELFLAHCLEVQGRLKGHYESLLEVGWKPAEAWAWTQRIEERILGPVVENFTEP